MNRVIIDILRNRIFCKITAYITNTKDVAQRYNTIHFMINYS